MTFLPTSKSRDTKTRPNIKKSGPIKFRYHALAYGIRVQLSVPIVNGGRDSF